MKKENNKRNHINGEKNCGLKKSKGRHFNYYEQNNSYFFHTNNLKLGLKPSSSNLSEIEKQKIRNYVIDLLGNDPLNCFKDIIYDDRFGSLRTISDRLGISRPTLRAYISTWLEILYGKEIVEDVIKLFWPENSARQKEKIRFYKIIEKYIRLYPKSISLIPTRNDLLKGDLHGIISKNTFKPWVIDYLAQVKCHNPCESHAVYDEIWGKACSTRNKIEYEKIKDFILYQNNGKARILTSRAVYELMTEYPTDRYIKISCGEGHEFLIQVRKLLYDYNWCPYCNELICERIMRNYLEQFFKKEFKVQVRLEQACGIDREKVIIRTIRINGVKYPIPVFVAQLRYDHFCPNVKVLGNDGINYKFAIAGEYDGFYHDERDIRKNPFCDSMEDLATINARDSIKNEVSYRKKIILIRLKEKDGFTRIKLLKNQKKVIQEIVLQFNEQVKDLFGLYDVQMKYDPYVRFDPLGNGVGYRIKDSLDDFL